MSLTRVFGVFWLYSYAMNLHMYAYQHEGFHPNVSVHRQMMIAFSGPVCLLLS
jgi:hypothetical protein